MNPTFSYNLWHTISGWCSKRHTTEFENEKQFIQALVEWNRISKLHTPVAWRYEVA